MDFFFPDQDPDIERFPPEKVVITNLQAEAYPDGRRVRVTLETTPFEQRPHIEVSLLDADGNEISSTSIIEPMAWKLEFTLHIRCDPPGNSFTLTAQLFYPEGPQAEPYSLNFEISPDP
ncbi:MAG: hypothetical protein JXA13_12740 [Anaerolineales bacterium]|nr:hypothetical protein [Anaerolineales bacterium]